MPSSPAAPPNPTRRPLPGRAVPAPDNLLGYYAGFISRTLALAIDAGLIAVTTVTVTWFVQVTAAMLQVNNFLGFSVQYLPWLTQLVDFISSPNLAAALMLLYVVAYYVFFWTFTGQTPGKALLGLRVVTTQGKRLPPWRALLRVVGYLLAGAPLFIGFFWALFDDRRQGWHDKLAGTHVIYTWPARPDERFLANELRRLEKLEGFDNQATRPDERAGD